MAFPYLAPPEICSWGEEPSSLWPLQVMPLVRSLLTSTGTLAIVLECIYCWFIPQLSELDDHISVGWHWSQFLYFLLFNLVFHSAVGSLVSLKGYVCKCHPCFVLRWIKEWLTDWFTNTYLSHKKKCKGGVSMDKINRGQGRETTVSAWPIKSLLVPKKSEKPSLLMWAVPLQLIKLIPLEIFSYLFFIYFLFCLCFREN